MKKRNWALVGLWMAAFASGCSRLPLAQEHPLTMESRSADDLAVVQQTRDAEARRENVLYLPARRVLEDEFRSPEFRELVEKMRSVMYRTGGIGIAANQVGKRLQLFMIEAKTDNPRYKGIGAVPFQVFANPRILKASRERRNFWHGCLSAVGEKRGNLATYEWVEVEAANAEGTVARHRLDGLAAVIFQHELRHLLGGTYLDKAEFLLDREELTRKLDSKELPFFERAGRELPHLIDDYHVGETLEEYYARRELK